jgi:hypothetical protein
MILRLRQLCCHPNLILVRNPFFPDLFYLMIRFFFASTSSCVKSQADEDDEPTLLVSGEGEDELGCARRVMGSEWVANLKRR